jgi:uncharacterized protein YndB with AHSA1/START domain
MSAPPERVWRTVGDPNHLPRWWPLVSRVDAVDGDAFTELLKTSRGRGIRADFRIVESVAPSVFRYEQQVEGSPFERMIRTNVTSVELEPDDGGTLVALTRQTKLRGLSALGGFMWRRAAAKQLDEALDALEGIHG